jgi:hypothetical protein
MTVMQGRNIEIVMVADDDGKQMTELVVHLIHGSLGQANVPFFIALQQTASKASASKIRVQGVFIRSQILERLG